MMTNNRILLMIPILLVFSFSLYSCTPKVEVTPPDKPITINLNIKIDHEVRIKVEKELDETLFSENSELF